jgi:eukaryotic-like serine/threonine-protein kinase
MSCPWACVILARLWQMDTLEAKKCESCNATFDRGIQFCPNCGSRLVTINTILGQTLDGRYRIDSVLGRGGMGVVYKATHIRLDAPCAVKILHRELVSNQLAIERFRREARAAGRIQHPNAIQVTDFGVAADNVVYLVMELVTGQTLRDIIKSNGPLDVDRATAIFSQVCAAVQAAHDSGVIHRDLKPDNIVLQRIAGGERVKVLDFGIAKLRERTVQPESQPLDPDSGSFEGTLTEAGMLIGTPQYMSPEQCRGRKLEPQSDIYSLGVVLFEMLSGELPFTGEIPMEIVLKQIKQAPPRVREIRPSIPPSVDEVVARALAKDPSERFASASDFGREVELAKGAAERYLVESKLPTLAGEYERPRRVTVVQRSGSVEQLELPSVVASSTREKRNFSTPLLAVLGLLVLIAVALVSHFVLKGQKAPVIPEGMVYVEGGRFLMGRNDGEEDERPAHDVAVPSFFLDKYEVTNRQYREFVDATGRARPRHWTINGAFDLADANLPVTNVTWNDARDFAIWKGKRLPTEAEWEYAGRGGSRQRLYPWGDEYREGIANVYRKGGSKLVVIGSYQGDVSVSGAYDLGGNVSEWVEDAFKRYGGVVDTPYKVFRGGNFMEPSEKATSTYRWYDTPRPPDESDREGFLSYVDQQRRLGFRCAGDIKR